MENFKMLNEQQLLEVDGGGIVYDFFYGAGKGVHMLVNDVVDTVKALNDPRSIIPIIYGL